MGCSASVAVQKSLPPQPTGSELRDPQSGPTGSSRSDTEPSRRSPHVERAVAAPVQPTSVPVAGSLWSEGGSPAGRLLSTCRLSCHFFTTLFRYYSFSASDASSPASARVVEQPENEVSSPSQSIDSDSSDEGAAFDERVNQANEAFNEIAQFLSAVAMQSASQMQGETKQREAEQNRLKEIAKLEQIEHEDEFKSMRVGDLRRLLDASFIDHKDCIEKIDFVRKAQRLWHNHCRKAALPEDALCKICCQEQADCVFLECGHMVSCMQCAVKVKECPMCREFITRKVHVFRS
eukprot:m.163120 g.163120  ORF g.163120 m.163120 type:complete len:292 (-) comp53072_c0_seq4:818-1693(-)